MFILNIFPVSKPVRITDLNVWYLLYVSYRFTVGQSGVVFLCSGTGCFCAGLVGFARFLPVSAG